MHKHKWLLTQPVLRTCSAPSQVMQQFGSYEYSSPVFPWYRYHHLAVSSNTGLLAHSTLCLAVSSACIERCTRVSVHVITRTLYVALSITLLLLFSQHCVCHMTTADIGVDATLHASTAISYNQQALCNSTCTGMYVACCVAC